MVCRPHRYIVSGIAAGGVSYAGGVASASYLNPAYSSVYSQARYETKNAMSTKYDLAMPYVFSSQGNSAEVTRTAKAYYGMPVNAAMNQFNTLRATQPTFDEPIDLSPAHIARIDPRPMEEQMTNPNIRKTKQMLAQMIMNELDALGPREEHTHDDGSSHEHGAHTHVH